MKRQWTGRLVNIQTGEKTRYYEENVDDIFRSVRGIFFKGEHYIDEKKGLVVNYDGRAHLAYLYRLDILAHKKSYKVEAILQETK